ncbi:glycosyltransferase [Carboxylicivirga sp. M1479]|uniref:glycosyltransferase n=1 Tax=Carboxylicivirga sp. M1479 TaxID=2594476 RepID=UPI00163DE267|nr:glycosyltransferase [Carboxylicivirga sp. M1479]
MEHTILYTLVAIFLFAWLFQIFYLLFFLLKPSLFKANTVEGKQLPISVIICAKNEAENLLQFIPSICQQNHPQFEVIVVNDCSTDDTEMALAQLKTKYNNLYYTSIPLSQQHYQGKKLALTLGIKAANYEHLLFTDADCQPTSDQWLSQMASQFSDTKEIVVGHGRYEKRKGLFNLFLRYETFFNAVQYMGFALRKKPFMAVGRNMAFTKSLFEKSNVYAQYLNVASGDDDLFMRQCANKQNTSIQLNYESQTSSIAPKNMGEWLDRKSRHLSTAPFYKLGIKAWLFMEALTRQIFWVLTLCSLFFPTFAPLAFGFFVSRLVVLHIVLGKAANKMGENKLYWATILFDFMNPLLIGSVWVINVFSAKKKKWK